MHPTLLLTLTAIWLSFPLMSWVDSGWGYGWGGWGNREHTHHKSGQSIKASILWTIGAYLKVLQLVAELGAVIGMVYNGQVGRRIRSKMCARGQPGGPIHKKQRTPTPTPTNTHHDASARTNDTLDAALHGARQGSAHAEAAIVQNLR
jgi:hypothetical protein